MTPSLDPTDPSPAYRRYGPREAPCVLVLGGISAGADLSWWKKMVGRGRALDPEHQQLLTVAPAPGSTEDQADRIEALLTKLKIPRLHTALGCSYGGMVAMALAQRAPDRVGRLALIAASHRSHPMATARRLVQRRILELGRRAGSPEDGVKLARMLAMISYRSDRGLDSRFSLESMESWLDHHGQRYAKVNPEWMAAMSVAMDEHRISPKAVKVPTTVIGFDTDQVVPPWLLEELVGYLPNGTLHILSSIHGHDAFILESEKLTPLVRSIVGHVR